MQNIVLGIKILYFKGITYYSFPELKTNRNFIPNHGMTDLVGRSSQVPIFTNN